MTGPLHWTAVKTESNFAQVKLAGDQSPFSADADICGRLKPPPETIDFPPKPGH
jgi:hypothetical protein